MRAFIVLSCLSLIACSGENHEAAKPEVVTEPVSQAMVNKEPVTNDDLMSGYQPEQVAANTYVIHGPLDMPNAENRGFMNNPGFVVTSDSVVVIDPGSSKQVGEALLKRIAAVTDKPITHIFNSHIHGDHWLGNNAIAQGNDNVKIYAHPEMIKEAKAGEAENWLSLLDNLTEGATKGTQALIPAIPLSDGEEIKVGGITFRAYLSEIAHTKTDAMIEVVEEGVLFAGDNLTYQRMTRMDDGSFRGNIAALDRAMTLDVKTVVPGHGPSGTKDVIKPLQHYLKTLYDMADEMRQEGLQDYEMKEKIATALETYKTWPGYEENFGKQISLAVLESEQAEFE